MKPTIYLGNWSGKASHGPGRKWTAMARPRHWERGEGTVWEITPKEEDLLAVKAGRITEEEYFERFRASVEANSSRLSPGSLQGGLPGGWVEADWIPLQDGDSILCACSKEAALAGKCHLTHAAPFLLRAGWRVRLHGMPAVLGTDGTLGVLGEWTVGHPERRQMSREWAYPLLSEVQAGLLAAMAIWTYPVVGGFFWFAELPGERRGFPTNGDAPSQDQAQAAADAALEKMLEERS